MDNSSLTIRNRVESALWSGIVGDALLVEWGVDDPVVAEPLLKALRRLKEDKALEEGSELNIAPLQQLGIICLITCIISLITGTISNPGSFPWLHGLLGFSLVALLLSSTFYWLYFMIRY